jgi:hypothetical protein
VSSREFLGRRAVRVVVVALFVVVVVLLFFVLNWYVDPKKPGERKDLVLAVAQILGGAALLSGLYFTWRTLQVNRKGQITDRFTRAIDQLGKVDDKGNKLFEIRVGVIYALQRIARESDEDYWPIMEILTAYVRQNAPWPPEEGQGGTDDATDEQSALEDSGGKSETNLYTVTGPDIQAIMTVLRRRSGSYKHGEPERLNLSETNLSGVNLEGANLEEANLQKASLWGASLRGVDFRGAHLWGANLIGADLWGTDLAGADLRGADLWGTYLWGADLSEAQNLTQGQVLVQRQDRFRLTGYSTHHENSYLCTSVVRRGARKP